uniref:non-specific serine/threonine protein kinase n=1 Tax=Acrobeloides nanus TaxID=290746 RepID=A0A914BVZ2_9BILA
MVITARKFDRKWRTRPSNIISKIVTDGDDPDEYLPKWDRMLKCEKKTKNIHVMKTPQRLLEELLVRDINEADDYELEIVPTKYQSNLLDPHGKMGYFPVEKNQELPMILDLDETFNDSWNTPPGRKLSRISEESNITIRRRTTLTSRPSTSANFSLIEEIYEEDEVNETLRPNLSESIKDINTIFNESCNSVIERKQSSVNEETTAIQKQDDTMEESSEIIEEELENVLNISAGRKSTFSEAPSTSIQRTPNIEKSRRINEEGMEIIEELLDILNTPMERKPSIKPCSTIKRSPILEESSTLEGDSERNTVEEEQIVDILSVEVGRKTSFNDILSISTQRPSTLEKSRSMLRENTGRSEASLFDVLNTPDEKKSRISVVPSTAIQSPSVDEESRILDENQSDKRPLDILLHFCNQSRIYRWCELPETIYSSAVKLGEGAYGEVFESDWDGEKVALKIMPFQDDLIAPYSGLVNEDYLKKPEDVIIELRLTKELSDLRETAYDKDGAAQMTPNFVRLVKTHVVQGHYPDELLRAWDEYKKKNKRNKKKESCNDRPDEYSAEDRLFIIFALSKGGEDLDNFKVKGEEEGMSIFSQVALSLHVAEKMLQFEHRDLHVSNILVTRDENFQELRYLIDGTEIFLKTHGIKVDIIDYTYSRIFVDGDYIYADLKNDVELFCQPGRDEGGIYQAEIYRKMREYNENEWKKFHPKTNVFWLHYLVWNLFLVKPRSIVTGMKGDRKLELEKIFDEKKLCTEFSSTTVLLNEPQICLLLEDYAIKGNSNKENIPIIKVPGLKRKHGIMTSIFGKKSSEPLKLASNGIVTRYHLTDTSMDFAIDVYEDKKACKNRDEIKQSFFVKIGQFPSQIDPSSAKFELVEAASGDCYFLFSCIKLDNLNQNWKEFQTTQGTLDKCSI